MSRTPSPLASNIIDEMNLKKDHYIYVDRSRFYAFFIDFMVISFLYLSYLMVTITLSKEIPSLEQLKESWNYPEFIALSIIYFVIGDSKLLGFGSMGKKSLNLKILYEDLEEVPGILTYWGRIFIFFLPTIFAAAMTESMMGRNNISDSDNMIIDIPEMLSLAWLLANYICCFTSKTNQTMYDMIFGTVVIRVVGKDYCPMGRGIFNTYSYNIFLEYQRMKERKELVREKGKSVLNPPEFGFASLNPVPCVFLSMSAGAALMALMLAFYTPKYTTDDVYHYRYITTQILGEMREKLRGTIASRSRGCKR